MALATLLLLFSPATTALPSGLRGGEATHPILSVLLVVVVVAAGVFSLMMYRRHKADQSAAKLQAVWKGDRTRRRLSFQVHQSYDSVRI